MDMYLTLAGLCLGCGLLALMVYLQKRPPDALWVHMVPATPIMLLAILIIVVALVHLVNSFGLQTGRRFSGGEANSGFRELEEEDMKKLMAPIIAIPAMLGVPGDQDVSAAQTPTKTAAKGDLSKPGNTQTGRSSAWERECKGGAGTETEVCYVKQFVLTQKGEVVLALMVGFLKGSQKEARAIFTTPLGAALPVGLSIKIDNKERESFAFSHCLRNGCQVFVPLKEPRFSDFMKGRNMQVGWKNLNGKPVITRIDLNGFSAAISSLKK